MAESEVTADARAWRRIRSGRPTPPHRFSPPPHLSLAAASVSYEEAEELLSSLDQLADAPPVVRYMGEWATIRCLIFSGHFHLVDEPLTRFEQLVEELDSENAKGGIAELRGHLAVADDDWITASRWFAETAATQTVERPNWFRLTIAWHALTARAICGERITGQDLREPWQWFRSEGINVLAWHGAVSTAVALDRLGRRDLAERLVRWARQSDPGGVMPRFERTLAAAGMYVERAESFDDLDDLIDEVIAFADELDRHAQFIGTPVEADRPRPIGWCYGRNREGDGDGDGWNHSVRDRTDRRGQHVGADAGRLRSRTLVAPQQLGSLARRVRRRRLRNACAGLAR